MQEIETFVSGRVCWVDKESESLLIPFVLSRVSAGFPSPAEDSSKPRLILTANLLGIRLLPSLSALPVIR